MSGISQAFTTALFHFLWQGVAVLLVFSILMFLLRRRSANSRYVAGCAAMAVMALLPVVTAWSVYAPAVEANPVSVSSPGDGSGEVFSGVLTIGMEVSRTVSEAVSEASWLEALRPWAIPVWSLGVVFFSLRLLRGYRFVRRMHRSAVSDSATFQLAAGISKRLGMTRRFRVMVSVLTDSPGVVGWLRPVILLPPATVLGLDPAQLEAVLAHELAHIRRYDYMVNVLQTLVEALLFYHPAVWWVSSSIRRERELCCDDVAVGAVGDRLRYARALAALERLRVGRPQLAVGATDASLSDRVRRIIMGQEIQNTRLPVVSGIVSLILCMVAVGATTVASPVSGQLQFGTVVPEPPPPPPPPPAPPAPIPPPPAPPPPAPEPPPPPPAPEFASQFFGLFDNDDVAWVLFRNGETRTFGSSVDQAEARIDRRNFEGDLLWVRMDGETYVIQDEGFLDDVDDLFAPMEDLGEDMRDLGEEMRVLGEEMRGLGEEMREVRVDIPDLTAQLDEIRTMLQSDATMGDLGRLQAEIGRLQASIGRIQGDAGRQQADIGRAQAAIGRQQAEIGRRQAEIGRQQAEAYRDASEALVEMVEDAIGTGLAERLD